VSKTKYKWVKSIDLYKPKHKQRRKKPKELKHLSIREKRKQSDFQSSGEEMKKEI